MKKKNYVYTKKDLFIGLEFQINDEKYELTSIKPLNFFNIRDKKSWIDYDMNYLLKQFNNNNKWVILNPKPQNIELWI
jgi:hypothetical protein